MVYVNDNDCDLTLMIPFKDKEKWTTSKDPEASTKMAMHNAAVESASAAGQFFPPEYFYLFSVEEI